MFVGEGGHSRHAKAEMQGEYRILRSAKHRYVYFCTRNKVLKKKWEEALRYPIKPYPKGDNDPDYTLGNFIKPTIISAKTGEIVEKVEYPWQQFSLFDDSIGA